jgi:amino acid adenylation domain-containing protein
MIATHTTRNDSSILAAAESRVSTADIPSAPKTLWQTFGEVAAKHGDRKAVTFGDQALTYRDLDAKANDLARRLRSLGVGPDSLVGVYLERSIESIIALVGVIKAGGAYLPLDPAYPKDRVAAILEDAQPVVLITEDDLRHKLPAHGAQEVFLGHDDSQPSLGAGQNDAPLSTPDSMAYVIYTSGSTGKPKGVMVTQANVARLLTATTQWFHFNEHDVWTLFHSLAFDFSVWEIWGCLLHGGRLIVVPFSVSRSPQEFYELLRKEQVTVLNQTPSAFYQLIAVDQLQKPTDLALRFVIFGGEALNFNALQPWFAAHGDTRPQLVNMYGITETTVHVTYRIVTTQDSSRAQSLIGLPIPDLQLYLLDDSAQLVADGETGEIYVGGRGVARGYLKRPELNAERFLADPFATSSDARMYKSGDLARRLPDGELEYLGRGDAQVKIQGFRIELGEIEAALLAHPAIRETRIVAHTDALGTKRLVAYYVGDNNAVETATLSQFLSAKLPPWMLPSAYVQIQAFPLTTNGKVDVTALPTPTFGSIRNNEETKTNSAEDKVASVWKEVLRADFVGLDDNFFDIGGTSLLLVSAHQKLQTQFNKRISIADLFAHTTVRSVAQHLAGSDAAVNPQDAAQVRARKQREAFARARAVKRAV